jgi:membrane protein
MAGNSPKMYLTRAGPVERFWRLLRLAAVATYENNCLSIAKGAAYSALLAFFPVVTTLATLLVLAKADDVSRTIAGLLYEVVPPGTEEVVRTLFIVHGQRPRGLLLVATLLAAFAASGVMVSLMEGFQAIYRIPAGRSILRERAVALLLVLASAAPLLGASALIVFGTRVERIIAGWMGGAELKGWADLAADVLRYGTSFGSVVLVTLLMYYFGPNRKQEFRRVFPGAILATVLWLLTTIVFGWYVRNVADYNVLYGSVGAGLALLVWMYVLALIVLLGCAFNAARERLLV